MTERAWWRDAVIYEIYPRSYADGNGDGTGDLAGVRSRLGHLVELGVDAIWFTPWYASPLADGGYDVADYRRIDPAFGTLADAEALIAEARALGIRTIVDVVPNHVSDQHPWFQAALAAAPGSPERARFWFRPGRGPGGDGRPTGWVSEFGGIPWTRTKNPDGTPGEWYLHLFSTGQPDLNWTHPDVRAEHEDVLRFWFDRGVAGVRIDSAVLPVKHPDLPEVPIDPAPGEHSYVDRDDLHEIYRSWRSIADSYPDERILVGEVWLPDTERFVRYLRPDELHTAFNFDFLARPWDADQLRTSIDDTLAAHAPVGAPATWVLSNHDVTRPVTRYGRAESGFSFAAKRAGTPTDLELGTRRARAAALLTAALPGALYIYQGDELGLPEHEQLDDDLRTDPMFLRSGGVDPGRDGCRVPLPWSGTEPPFGFSAVDTATAARTGIRGTGPAESPAVSRPTWLPQPPEWAALTVEAQAADPGSTLALYRAALRIRRAEVGGAFTWLPAEDGVLAFRRGPAFACVVNLAPHPVPLPAHEEVLLTSGDLAHDDALPSDTAVWLRLSDREERR